MLLSWMTIRLSRRWNAVVDDAHDTTHISMVIVNMIGLDLMTMQI